jgi:hypothetical protein
MTIACLPLTRITDAELLTAVARAAAHERSATVQLIALLAELDARRLYLDEGCSSLFTYCTQILRLSEHAAYGRIEAARCVRRFPIVLDMLAEGALTLTTAGLPAPHLTLDISQEVLATARHKSRRAVEQIVASLRPLPPVPSSVRELPSPTASAAEQMKGDSGHEVDGAISDAGARRPDVAGAPIAARQPARQAVMTALAPERYKLVVILSRDTHDNLRKAQDLLRHIVPNGDPAAIVDRALRLLVADLEKTRMAATTRPRLPRDARAGSRHVPAAVKRQVRARDAGQCAFVGTQGRCTERGLLEIHHRVPFAAGGRAVTENQELRCRRHNAYEAELFFGTRPRPEPEPVHDGTRPEPSP